MLSLFKLNTIKNVPAVKVAYFSTDVKKKVGKKKETSVSINNLKKTLNTKKESKKITLKALSFGVVIRVKDGVAFARDLGFASFGELAVFIPSPSRLNTLKTQIEYWCDPNNITNKTVEVIHLYYNQ